MVSIYLNRQFQSEPQLWKNVNQWVWEEGMFPDIVLFSYIPTSSPHKDRSYIKLSCCSLIGEIRLILQLWEG